MINLFLVDDHDFLNQGIKAVLIKHCNAIKVIGSATSGIDALKQLETLKVDIVLLDIVMPEMDGITCCSRIKNVFPEIKIIAFTGELNPEILIQIWLQKADGILLKTCGINELISTIKDVMSGQKIIGKHVPSFFELCEISETKSTPKLTRTELEVLKLLATGLTRQQVADKMYRSKYTVEFHCKNLLKKFKTNRINSIIAEARKERIIK